MRTLIIEDDADLLAQLSLAMSAAGFAVDRAAEGEDGEFLGSTNAYDIASLTAVARSSLRFSISACRGSTVSRSCGGGGLRAATFRFWFSLHAGPGPTRPRRSRPAPTIM